VTLQPASARNTAAYAGLIGFDGHDLLYRKVICRQKVATLNQTGNFFHI
jgi:hypothetical protein